MYRCSAKATIVIPNQIANREKIIKMATVKAAKKPTAALPIMVKRDQILLTINRNVAINVLAKILSEAVDVAKETSAALPTMVTRNQIRSATKTVNNKEEAKIVGAGADVAEETTVVLPITATAKTVNVKEAIGVDPEIEGPDVDAVKETTEVLSTLILLTAKMVNGREVIIIKVEMVDLVAAKKAVTITLAVKAIGKDLVATVATIAALKAVIGKFNDQLIFNNTAKLCSKFFNNFLLSCT